MATNRKFEDDIDDDDDIDAIEDDIVIDPFLEAMEMQDNKRAKANSPRRKIEAIQEKLRLRRLLDDYLDFD